MKARPAPFLLRLAVRFLPADVRQDVLGDLIEHWHEDVSHRSPVARARWLTRQPFAALRSRMRFGTKGDASLSAPSQPHRDFGFSWLDVKLGLRMLVKHPGVTLVIVFALGIGIPASLTPNHLIDAFIDESPPFEDGDRVVGQLALN